MIVEPRKFDRCPSSCSSYKCVVSSVYPTTCVFIEDRDSTFLNTQNITLFMKQSTYLTRLFHFTLKNHYRSVIYIQYHSHI